MKRPNGAPKLTHGRRAGEKPRERPSADPPVMLLPSAHAPLPGQRTRWAGPNSSPLKECAIISESRTPTAKDIFPAHRGGRGKTLGGMMRGRRRRFVERGRRGDPPQCGRDGGGGGRPQPAAGPPRPEAHVSHKLHSVFDDHTHR